MANLPEQNAPPAYTTTCPTVKEVGMTILHEPVNEASIVADLVFVHGLGGHPERTWSTSKVPPAGDGSKSKKRKQDKKSKSDDQNDCFWPWDLVRRDFEALRIMTYGYDSDPRKGSSTPTNEMTITQHGIQLLNAVIAKRHTCQDRPLLFVGHSLGGIIVMGAMNESFKAFPEPDISPRPELLRSVSKSCTGIFFSATPHRGSQMAQWAVICMNVIDSFPLSANVSRQIIKQLKLGSEILSAIEREFNRVRKKERLNVYSYYESVAMSHIKFFDGKVVPDISASFNDSDVHEHWVNANHVGMCKFRSEEDQSYQDFKFQLELNLDWIMTKTKAKRVAQSDAKNTALQEKLDFDGRHIRQRAMADKLLDTNVETFKWIWKSDFVQWLRQSKNCGHIFWISGKPASGKSSMMNFIVESDDTQELARQREGQYWTIIHHFFDFRAEKGITNNLEGFLRSLAVQVIKESARARIDASGLSDLLPRTGATHSESLPVTVPKLHQAVIDAFQHATENILVFLDGLDEYSGDKHGLYGIIKQISSSKCRVCVASRPDNPFPTLMKGIPQIRMQDHNHEANQLYARERLMAASIDEFTSDRWSKEVADRALGVFLWTRFAVDAVIDATDNGLNLDSKRMRETLLAVPTELKDIYARKLQHLPGADKEVAGLLLLLIWRCHGGAISLTCLWQIMHNIPVNDEGLSLFSDAVNSFRDSVQEQTFEVYLNGCAGNFVHLRQRRPGDSLLRGAQMVEINHRTVETYFEESGWPQLFARTDMRTLGHQLWLLTGVQTLGRKNGKADRDSWKVLAKDYDVSEPESLVYSARYLLDHAALFELESGCSSFDMLHGRLPTGLMACHDVQELSLEEDWGHIYNRGSDFGSTFWYFDYYKRSKAEITIVEEMLVYHGVTLYVKDYLKHKDSDQLVKLGSEHAASRENLFIDEAKLPNEGGVSLITHKELVRRAAMRTLFSDFKARPNFDHYFEAAKTVLALCRRIESSDLMAAIFCCRWEMPQLLKTGLSVTRPGRVSFPPYTDLIQAFDDTSQVQKDCTTTLGPFWALGLALWVVSFYEASSKNTAHQIFDLFLDRGHDISEVCGPYGTIWHSYITGIVSYGSGIGSGADPMSALPMLQELGANPRKRGPCGNALEFLWRVLHSPRAIWLVRYNDLSNSFEQIPVIWYGIDILTHLLERGVPNQVADPNGKIPTVDEMQAFSRLNQESPIEEDEDGEDAAGRNEERWIATIRHYYQSASKEAKLANKLLNMTDDRELRRFWENDDDWFPRLEPEES